MQQQDNEVKDYPAFMSTVLEAPESRLAYKIEIPGVSVLVGQNGVGKSTVCKSIYEFVQNGNLPAYKNIHITFLNAQTLHCFDMRPGSWYLDNRAGDQALICTRKVRLSSYDDVPDFGMEVVEEIELAIGGRMYYDEDSKTFFLKPSGKGKLRVPAKNLPSGVLTLGLLQMIAVSYYDGASRPPILIIDDLEGTLHPAWQIVYASILFKFAAKGIRVLTTVNSVYTLEAITHYAERHGEFGDGARVHKRTYLGKVDVNGSVFDDVSDDNNALYGPFSKLMHRFL